MENKSQGTRQKPNMDNYMHPLRNSIASLPTRQVRKTFTLLRQLVDVSDTSPPAQHCYIPMLGVTLGQFSTASVLNRPWKGNTLEPPESTRGE